MCKEQYDNVIILLKNVRITAVYVRYNGRQDGVSTIARGIKATSNNFQLNFTFI